MTEAISSGSQLNYGFLDLNYSVSENNNLNSIFDNFKNVSRSDNVDVQISSLLEIVNNLKYVINSDLKNTIRLQGLISQQKINQALDESEKQLKELAASKKSKIISGIMKILKPLLLVVSAILVVVAPSPLTIGMFAFSLFDFIDSSVSQATGNESMLSKAMTAITKPLENSDLPHWLKMALPAIVGLAAVVAVAYGAGAAGYAALKAFTDTAVSPFAKLMTLMEAGDAEGAQVYLSKLVENVGNASSVIQIAGNTTGQAFNLKASHADFDLQNIQAHISELENLGSYFSQSISNYKHDIQSNESIASNF